MIEGAYMKKHCILFLIITLMIVQNGMPLWAQTFVDVDSNERVISTGDVPSGEEIGVMPGSTSSKITLELKGVDILDVLKVLSKKSGLNIVAGKNVRGQVTLFLQDVEVWDALKIVLETSELAYERKGDIIKVITASDYEAMYGRPYETKKKTVLVKLLYARAQIVQEVISQIKSSVGRIVVDESTNSLILNDTPIAIDEMKAAIKEIDVPMQTRVYHLRYANAEDMESKISEIITPNIGILKVDARTNKIVVTDIPAKLDHIDEIVAAFDEKPKQVLIEAKIIEVALDDEYVLGVDWDAVFQRTEVSPITYESNTIGGTGASGFSGPLSSATGNLPTFTINSSNEEFYAIINALQGMGKANTLSNPRVTVVNNEEATIAVATREPFVSQTVVQGDNTSTTADNVEFVDVGVTLSVTPNITNDDYIMMEIKPTVSTAGDSLELESGDGSGSTFTRTVVPVVTEQEVETKVLVKSGKTIVLGGLIQDAESVNIRKVPLLGDIPWIGAAFRNKSDDFKKTELVIFITPQIISPDISSTEVNKYYDSNGTKIKFNEFGGPGKEFNERTTNTQPVLQVDEQPYWEKNIRNAFNSTLDGGMVSVNSPTSLHTLSYEERVRNQVIRALQSTPSLQSLQGEVRVLITLKPNGYVKSIQAEAIEQPQLNAEITKAISGYAPYPPSPQTRQGETSVQFSLVF